MVSFIPAAQRQLIKDCAEHGCGIEGLVDAPNFRFTPAADMIGESATNVWGHEFPYVAKPLHDGKPSSRGSVRGTVAKGFPKLKNWTVPSYSLAPNYNIPMNGDDPDLTDARRSWHRGNPDPLRVYLAEQAEARRAAKLFA